jgi:hypothetical protein
MQNGLKLKLYLFPRHNSQQGVQKCALNIIVQKQCTDTINSMQRYITDTCGPMMYSLDTESNIR